ncbi:DUF4352 domain-containing protein [Candidatus Nanohalovita haloferacivicina]|uniref:DUF4352 domain-containing protein n=1 Tax=Candidatus Nanohalovita haloferacivicina TaxID=2978046 RepID=UPI00325FBD1D
MSKTVSWIFGVLLILAGLGALTTSPIAGIIYFLTGIFLIPNIRQEIDQRYNITFSRWVVVLVTVIGLGLGAAMMPGDATSPTSNNTNNQEPARDTGSQDSSQPSKEDRTHEIGTEFTVGDVRYRVNGVTTRQEIGERVAGTLMGVEANGKFLIVDTTVMNEANEAITMRESSLKVMIGDSEYSPSSEAWVYMDDSFTFEQLNPGVQVDGDVAYDVPASANTSSMKLEVNPVGVFSTAEPHYVSLG